MVTYYMIYKNNRQAKRRKYPTLGSAFMDMLDMLNPRDFFKIVQFDINYEFGSRKFDALYIDKETGECYVIIPRKWDENDDWLAYDAMSYGFCPTCWRVRDKNHKHFGSDYYCMCEYCCEKY